MTTNMNFKFILKHADVLLISMFLKLRYIPGFSFKVIKSPLDVDRKIYGVMSKDYSYVLYFIGVRIIAINLTNKQYILLRFFFSRVDLRTKVVINRLINVLPSKSIIVEVGAGVGVISRRLSPFFSQKIFFEPSVEMFSFLVDYRSDEKAIFLNKAIQNADDISNVLIGAGFEKEKPRSA